MRSTFVNDVDALPGENLVFWVVTHDTADHGDKYVVRRQVAKADEVLFERSCEVSDTLEEAREKIPSDKCRLPRHPKDDPVIVESWV